MKKNILQLLLCLLLVHTIAAQTIKVRREAFRPINADQQPLIIVDSVITDFNHLLLKPGKIESMDVLKDSASVSAYGEKAKNGVIIIRTKKNTDVVQLNELLNYYNIAQKDRNLKVCLDHILVNDTDKLIADKDDIKIVEVITDICWISPTQAGPEERYINIVTKREKKFY